MRRIVARIVAAGRLRLVIAMAMAASGAAGLALPAPAAILGLFAASSTGCLCDCAGTFNRGSIGSSVPVTGLTSTGDGCGEISCEVPSAGACSEYVVKLVQSGACHLTATADDGRQVAADFSVVQTRTTCCGPMYDIVSSPSAGHAIELTFDAPDGSAGG
jgi:hypothetical protein